MAIVTSKHNRDLLQQRANRGSPQIATSVELDFVYPPQCNILGVTQYAIKANSMLLELVAGKELGRCPRFPIQIEISLLVS